MYMTNIPAADSGQFSGNITVSMRPMTMQQAIKATKSLLVLKMYMVHLCILEILQKLVFLI